MNLILKFLILAISVGSLIIVNFLTEEKQSQQLTTEINLQYDQNYNLIKLNQVGDNSAKCLDGSPAAFYYKQGSSDKYIIHFEGGGWCGDVSLNQTLKKCLERSKTDLGSSSQYPQQITFDGIFNRDPALNPEFYNHTTIQIKYCDGSGHQGYNLEPFNVNGTNIWFRGYNNTVQTIEYLINNLALGKANDVIITGASAGGLATFTWVDWIHEKLKQINTNVKVIGMPDSGLFLDMPTGANQSFYIQRTKIQNVMALANKEVDPVNQECVDTHKDAKWKCMYSENLILYVQTPLFLIESQYDRWSIENILQYSCANNGNLTTCKPDENQKIQNYRQKTIGVIEDSLKRNPRWGAWSPSCIDHVYTGIAFNNQSYEIPQNSNWTLSRTIQEWIHSSSNVTIKQIDTNPWPSNYPCSHI